MPKATPTPSLQQLEPQASGPGAVLGCPLSFSFDGRGKNYQRVFVAGEFNGWAEEKDQLTDTDGDGIYTGRFIYDALKPGRYSYKIVASGAAGKEWLLDNVNTRQRRSGEQVNSMIVLADCRQPTWSFVSREATSGNAAGSGVTVVAKLSAGGAQDSIDPTRISARRANGDPLPVQFDAATGLATVNIPKGIGKTSVTFVAGSPYGEATLYVPVWLSHQNFSFADATMYFAFTDRFKNGDTSNDAPASCLPSNSQANWLGGDWAGLAQAIDEGYFDALAVDALWISPINDNPGGCYKGSLGREYASYHGYFPLDFEGLEEHFGDEAALRRLVETAHRHGIRVLIDFVANHLHQESPIVNAKRSWFNPLYQCGWEKPLVCWFEPYLPDLDYTNDEVNEAVVQGALRYVERFDLDGFRFDAAKHIGHELVHNLRAELRERTEHLPGDHFYMVGETFTGGWTPTDSSQVDMIKEWVSKDELSGQFDFPLWYEILYAFGKQSRGFSSLRAFLLANQKHYPAGSVMSAFSDNHDVPRFISHADNLVNSYAVMDDTSSDAAKQLGWGQPPGTAGRRESYALAEAAAAFLFSQSEVPLIYYGDEIGLPGAGDPDNRRLMPWSGLLEGQLALRERYRSLGKLRKQHPALRSASFELSGLVPMEDPRNEDVFAWVKRAGTERILVVIDRRFYGNQESYPLWLPNDILPGSVLTDLETGESFTSVAQTVTVVMGRPQARFLEVK